MQHHKPSKFRDNLRDVVFGLEDGMVSTLGVITGIAIGSGSRFAVLLAGFVVIFVESLSMSAGTFLSSKSERESLQKEIDEELEEIRKNKGGEMEEWRQFYRDRGLHEDDIAKIENHYRDDEKLLLEDMMHKELGITRRFLRNPGENAWFMFFSYFVGGSVALGAYLVLPMDIALPVSVAFTFAVLFGVGFAKGKFVGISPWKSGLEMLLVSLAAAVVGFAVGKLAGAYLPADVL